jgi:hypothetical protein
MNPTIPMSGGGRSHFPPAQVNDFLEDVVPFAVELFLDERSESRVREIWSALDTHGVMSLGAMPGADYHPHVSLFAFELGDLATVEATLRSVFLAGHPVPVPLANLGFFLTGEAVAFLGVIPSGALLRLHRAVHAALSPLVRGIGGYYHPDQLLPHCTLASGIEDKAKVVDVVSGFSLPITAHSAQARLVEVPGGRVLAGFGFGSEKREGKPGNAS